MARRLCYTLVAAVLWCIHHGEASFSHVPATTALPIVVSWPDSRVVDEGDINKAVWSMLPYPLLAFSVAPRPSSTAPLREGKGWHVSSSASSTEGRTQRWLSKVGRGVRNGIGGMGTVAPLVWLERARASPFDPHPMPFLLGMAFFNGWCVRVTDHEKGLSFAVIVGSFKHKHAESYTEHYVALVYSDKDGNRVTAHAFPDPEGVAITSNSDGLTGVPSNFTWRSPDVGELRIEDNKGRFNFRLPGFSAVGTIHDRVPWDSAFPDSAGPEGWLGMTPLLPCRYFVHSLASKTSYALRIRGREPHDRPGTTHALDMREAASWGCEIHGRGYAHMECNYGKHFPAGWVWAQAVSSLRDVKLIMVGGKFQIGPATPTTWAIGYRSPRFSWNFRTTDMDTVEADVDYTRKGVKLTATSSCGKKRLEVDITAPEGSFGSPIYVPTPQGFSSHPGCRDSFVSRARIRALDLSTPRMRIVEEHEIEFAALEFGGNMQRL